MIYTPLTMLAMRICFDAHKDQVDKSGVPYVFHPMHVAEQMEDELTTCAALLHDVQEDTSITEQELREAGIPEAVLGALRLLTHAEGVTYLEYVRAAKANPIARAVKRADLLHNSDLTRLGREPNAADLERVEKYQKALDLLDD